VRGITSSHLVGAWIGKSAGFSPSSLFSYRYSSFARLAGQSGAGAGFDALDDIVVKPIA
jgi:hypothetical protein